MLHDPKLLDVLEGLAIDGGWSGQVFRQTIDSRDPLLPNSRGARWNPPAIDTLYCSLSDRGAQAEVASLLSRQPIATSMPLIMSRLDILLTKVTDLRDAPSLTELGFGTTVLTGEDWQAARAVGAATAWLGFAGILVPSARHDDGNLVIFVNNLQPDDLVTLVGSP